MRLPLDGYLQRILPDWHAQQEQGHHRRGCLFYTCLLDVLCIISHPFYKEELFGLLKYAGDLDALMDDIFPLLQREGLIVKETIVDFEGKQLPDSIRSETKRTKDGTQSLIERIVEAFRMNRNRDPKWSCPLRVNCLISFFLHYTSDIVEYYSYFYFSINTKDDYGINNSREKTGY